MTGKINHGQSWAIKLTAKALYMLMVGFDESFSFQIRPIFRAFAVSFREGSLWLLVEVCCWNGGKRAMWKGSYSTYSTERVT